MSSLMHYNATGTLGSLPTTIPVQYLVSFDKAPSTSGIRHDFGSIIASHDESYSLWNDKDIASAPLKSYVLVCKMKHSAFGMHYIRISRIVLID